MEHCNIEVVGRLTDLKFGVEQNRKFSVRPEFVVHYRLAVEVIENRK